MGKSATGFTFAPFSSGYTYNVNIDSYPFYVLAEMTDTGMPAGVSVQHVESGNCFEQVNTSYGTSYRHPAWASSSCWIAPPASGDYEILLKMDCPISADCIENSGQACGDAGECKYQGAYDCVGFCAGAGNKEEGESCAGGAGECDESGNCVSTESDCPPSSENCDWILNSIVTIQYKKSPKKI